MVTKNELIEYISPLLKEYGFKKKGSAWLKTTESFTYRCYIQGSVYGSDQYYIRPGIIINRIPSDGIKYGHISADIAVTTKEEVWSKTQELNGFHKYILTIRELFGALFYCLFLR